MLNIPDNYVFVVWPTPNNLYAGFYTEGIGEEVQLLNVANFLVQEGHMVFCPQSKVSGWGISGSKPDNLILGSFPKKGTKYIFIGYSNNPPITNDCVLMVLYAFDFFKFSAHYTVPFVIVHPYPAGSRFNKLNIKYRNNFYFLPHVVPENMCNYANVKQNAIFWTTKGGFTTHSQPASTVDRLIAWVSSAMKKDSTLVFNMLCWGGGVYSDDGTKTGILKNSLFKNQLAWAGDRVAFLERISYGDMLHYMSTSKYVINQGIFNHTYCGAPIEAAWCGIPTINYKESPFMLFKDVLAVDGASSVAEYISFLDKLKENDAFYKDKSLKYKQYVSDTYSYNNYRSILNNILSSRL